MAAGSAGRDRRFRNTVGIAAAGPMYGSVAALARQVGAPESVVENLAIIQSGFFIGPRLIIGPRLSNRIRLSPTHTHAAPERRGLPDQKPPTVKRRNGRETNQAEGADRDQFYRTKKEKKRASEKISQPALKNSSGTFVAKKRIPKVTAVAEVEGQSFRGTNQTAREHRDANKRTAAANEIESRPSFSKDDPNTNMANAHAEIEAMHKASDAGMTNNVNMTITLTGKKMCQFCMNDVPLMAEKIGLKSLKVIDPQGNVSVWKKGDIGFLKGD